MRWSRTWVLPAPGSRAGVVGFDPTTDSALIADGWGVAFPSLEVRRVEVTTGRVAAVVRTRTGIRGFGAPPEPGRPLHFVGDKAVFEHDARTLERTRAATHRVPRYSNQVVGLQEGSVVLGTPKALAEYDMITGKVRRVYPAKPTAIARCGVRVIVVLADGTVLARSDDWEKVGSFPGAQHASAIDSTGLVASVGCSLEQSEQSRLSKPAYHISASSSELYVAHLSNWQPTRIQMPFASVQIGIVGGHIVVANATVASVPSSRLDAGWQEDELPGRVVGFVGDRGVVTSSVDTPLSISCFGFAVQ